MEERKSVKHDGWMRESEETQRIIFALEFRSLQYDQQVAKQIDDLKVLLLSIYGASSRSTI
jgi:hypothetical protein